MRVLFLFHALNDISIGGVAEFISFLPVSLKKKNIEVILYHQAKDKSTYRLDMPHVLPNGVKQFCGPFLKPGFFVSKRTLNPLIALCQREKIDLIHAHGAYRTGYVAMYIKKYAGIPYVVTSHSDIAETNSKRMRKRSVKNRYKKILENADYVTHLTPIMEIHAEKICTTTHKSRIIHNGIDVDAWPNASSEQPYLLAIGRLEIEKGFGVLINMLAELKNKGMTESLVIAGVGSAETQFKKQVQQLGLNIINDDTANIIQRFDQNKIPPNSVIFTGYVRGEEKKLLFKHAKTILFATQPSGWEEAFGIVQLEAMAAGNAMIASDISASRYLQQLGMQAVLVEPDNVSAWVNASCELLNHPERRKQMGEQNRLAVKQFDWDHIAAEYAKVYEDVLSKNKND